MKKFSRLTKTMLCLLMVLAMLAVSACSSSSSSSDSDDETDAEADDETTEVKGKIAYIVGNLGDKSFSDSGEEGMDILREEGWDVKTVETGDSTNADKFEDYILDCIDEGYEYIVASSTYEDYMLALQDEYPDVYFIIFDENLDESELSDNSVCIFYSQNEGSFLVGILAAGMTETGVVACDVGIESPTINDFVTGFIAGVQYYNSEVKVVVSACGSWSDAATMKTIVTDQYRNNNADVFYQVAGGSGDGLFEACAELGAWAIGVDSDQYEYYIDSENPEKAEVILTSMLKEVGNSLVAFFHSVEDGTAEWGTTTQLGLADDSVGYVINDFFEENVPEEIQEAMAEAAEAIANGEYDVPSYYDFADESEYLEYVNSAS